MRSRHVIVLILLAAAVGGLSGATASRTFQSDNLHASVGTEASGQTNWEHCAVLSASSIGRQDGGSYVAARIHYFSPLGSKQEEVAGASPGEAFDAAVAKLGAQGWELVGGDLFREVVGNRFQNTSSSGVLYFKRLRR
jgi:hypothetical protein